MFQLEDIKQISRKTLNCIADKVVDLQQTITNNNRGLPIAYIDAEVIAGTGMLEGSITDEVIKQATVPISYLEGYAVVGGKPFWERLENEPIDVYKVFASYRDMKLTDGTRSLGEIAHRANVDESLIHILSRMYHWQVRCKAFDAYNAQLREAVREYNTQLMENRHLEAARQLFNMCIDFIKENSKQLTHKSAFKWMELAIKLERLSLGLDPDKPELASNTGSRTIIQNYQIAGGANNNHQNEEIQNKTNVKDLGEIIDILSRAGVLTPESACEDSERESYKLLPLDNNQHHNGAAQDWTRSVSGGRLLPFNRPVNEAEDRPE